MLSLKAIIRIIPMYLSRASEKKLIFVEAHTQFCVRSYIKSKCHKEAPFMTHHSSMRFEGKKVLFMLKRGYFWKTFNVHIKSLHTH